ncbi:MAG: hypothetical protein ACT443_02060, partial [Gemmatimonadota bacterium]
GATGRRYGNALRDGATGRRYGNALRDGATGRRYGNALRDGATGRRHFAYFAQFAYLGRQAPRNFRTVSTTGALSRSPGH